MEQSFRDRLIEKRKRSVRLRTLDLAEAAVKNPGERLWLIAKGDRMQTMLTNLRLPMIVSFLLILPLMIMELVNRRNFNEGFPFPLFILMWLLPVLFILTGMPIVRSARAGSSILAKPILLLVRVVLLSFLAWFWVSLLIDQMPCFLGVPNCD